MPGRYGEAGLGPQGDSAADTALERGKPRLVDACDHQGGGMERDRPAVALRAAQQGAGRGSGGIGAKQLRKARSLAPADDLEQAEAVDRGALERLRQDGRSLPGTPELVGAAMGGMLAMLAYALLPGRSSENSANYSDDEVIDTLTALLLNGLSGGR